ncbi:hypothetical protein QBZ16_001931 [Prototheca wickerhamii]|uniref:3-oxo-5-alpha-steroid 4-dehydrogenase C-terminal domain-containing protein n=1 Tax=Prototheca wickerhamii TaxID=3111 RepID=A0AAD9INB0_PROWI|nr:hypothetical protein QBZ16_001931 [Prototheca wickerhamii]
MIGTGVLAAAVLLAGVAAPYGRYSASGWGPLIPARLAWLVRATQEIWSLAVPVVWLAFFATDSQLQRVSSPANLALLGAFLVHYIHRDLIYPFRIVPGRPTPLVVWASAAFFCIFNGYLQTRYLLCDAPGGPLGPRHALGLALWAAGFAINLQSDSLLIRQRRAKRAKDGGYSIPHGGLFGLVSCANYFGEVVEWAGWALAGASLPAAAFALFTAANLVPRCAG